MRTTLDLPDELLREAKITAVRRRTTLRALVKQALARELGTDGRGPAGKRARLPIFPSRAPGALDVTSEDLAGLESREDARRHGRAR
jgi:hypothetical protein